MFFISLSLDANERAECLALTKAMQRTADSLQSVADLYDDHVRTLFNLGSATHLRSFYRLAALNSQHTKV